MIAFGAKGLRQFVGGGEIRFAEYSATDARPGQLEEVARAVGGHEAIAPGAFAAGREEAQGRDWSSPQAFNGAAEFPRAAALVR